MTAERQIAIIPSNPRYATQMAEFMGAVYGCEPSDETQVFTAEQFRQHIRIFPEGQFTALDGERVIGLTVSMRISFDPAQPFIEPWWETVNHGWLRHDPEGEWMYGVESCVSRAYQGHGIGSRLMEARFETARRLNLRGMVAGSALVGYAIVAEQVSPQEYVKGVVEGRFFDNNLSKQLRKGFVPGAVIPNYVLDTDALGWGAVIVWENPAYDPMLRVKRQRLKTRRSSMKVTGVSSGVSPSI